MFVKCSEVWKYWTLVPGNEFRGDNVNRMSDKFNLFSRGVIVRVHIDYGGEETLWKIPVTGYFGIKLRNEQNIRVYMSFFTDTRRHQPLYNYYSGHCI
jgi:hypothetical protein